MEDSGTKPGDLRWVDADPGELMERFRWTQALARRLVRDAATADDVHQEVWSRAFERFGNVVPGRDWLAGAVRSLAFRAGRSRRRRLAHEARAARPEGVMSAEDLVQRSEAQQRVAAAVGRLPVILRTPLQLHFQEGLPLSSVAAHLGVSKSTAGERVQRGLAALRSDLRSWDDGWRSCCLIAVPFGRAAGLISASALPATAGSVLALGAITMKKSLIVAAGIAVMGAVLWLLMGRGVDRDVAALGPVADPGRSVGPLAGAEPDLAPVSAEEAETQRASVAPGPEVAAPDGSFLFKVAVVDSLGVPVPNPHMGATSWDWAREAVGDEAGLVELQLVATDLETIQGRDVEIVVTGTRYQTLWRTYVWGDGTGPVDPPRRGAAHDFGVVVLEPAGALEGMAYDDTRRPIAGAEIRFHGVDPRDSEQRLSYQGVAPEVVTDSDGRFFAPHLAAGPVGLTVWHADYLRKCPPTVTDVVAGRTRGPVSIFGTPADIVTGRVVDSAGLPMGDVSVNGTENWSVTDTDRTTKDGRFRIGLRRVSPAAVRVHFPGWRQVSPPVDELQGPGEIEIVMERVVEPARYSVLVVDEGSGEPLHAAGVAVRAGAAPSEPGAAHSGGKPAPVVQAAEGIPIDFVRGEDSLFVWARGFRSRVVSTADFPEGARVLTVALEREAGVRGRVLQGGQPLAGVRVLLVELRFQFAEPREVTGGGRVTRIPEETIDLEALTGRRSYSSGPVLGLGDTPPPYRVLSSGATHGERTDEEGRFLFEVVEGRRLGLQVELDGAPPRLVSTHIVENGALDLGDVELGPPGGGTLSGQFTSGWAWSPGDYSLVSEEPEHEIPLGPDGSFRVEDLAAGPFYFTVRRMRNAPDRGDFKDIPDFCVELAQGEQRWITAALDPYAPSFLELEVTVGGKPPLRGGMIEAVPVDDPGRPVDLWCQVEGLRVTADTTALGPCALSLSQSNSAQGWAKLHFPGEPFDFRAGEVLKRTVDIPAGWLRIEIPAGHGCTEYSHLDLLLRDGDREAEVRRIKLGTGAEGRAAGAQTLRTAPIPPGRYRASLMPNRSRDSEASVPVLGQFDVTIVDGETSTTALK